MALASATCGKNTTAQIGYTMEYPLTVNDSNFGSTQRYYYLDLPEDYNASKKYTVLFYWYGHGDDGYL